MRTVITDGSCCCRGNECALAVTGYGSQSDTPIVNRHTDPANPAIVYYGRRFAVPRDDLTQQRYTFSLQNVFEGEDGIAPVSGAVLVGENWRARITSAGHASSISFTVRKTLFSSFTSGGGAWPDRTFTNSAELAINRTCQPPNAVLPDIAFIDYIQEETFHPFMGNQGGIVERGRERLPLAAFPVVSFNLDPYMLVMEYAMGFTPQGAAYWETNYGTSRTGRIRIVFY